MCESSPDFMVTIDRERKFRWVNRLHPGITLDQVIGRPIDDFETADTHERSRAATTRAFETGEPQSFESHVKMNNGVDEAWYYVRCIPVAGHADRLLLVTSDITERKLAEHSRDALVRQLHQSRRMEALGRLAGGVAHDFNNLLTPILAYTQLAMNMLADEHDACEAIQGVHDAALRAAELTGQLLSVGRGREPGSEVLDLAAVVRGMMRILRRVVPENISLDMSHLRDSAYVRADQGQLEQVLLNLVLNACDALAGDGSIEIGTEAAGDEAVLWVRDTGIGMDAEVIERLFEPFFTTKGSQGTGLGLATAHGIIQENGGRIEVASRPGEGSTFRVILPSCDPLATDATATDDDAAAPGRVATVLVVEDEVLVRNMVVRLLARAQHTVLEAASGDEALVHAQATPIDIVLTDVVMPGLSGPEVVRRVRALHPQVQAIFMSGHVMNRLSQDDLRGARVLRKPFTRPQLLAAIQASLRPAEPNPVG